MSEQATSEPRWARYSVVKIGEPSAEIEPKDIRLFTNADETIYIFRAFTEEKYPDVRVGNLYDTLEDPTEPMRREAASAGFYDAAALGRKYPKVQVLTIAELLSGKELQYPRLDVVTFKRAPSKAKRSHEYLGIEWEEAASEQDSQEDDLAIMSQRSEATGNGC